METKTYKLKDYFTVDPSKNTNKYDDYINYIDTSSVVSGELMTVQHLTEDYPSRANKRIEKDDILYSSVRPILKHFYHYENIIDHAIASTGFCVIRNKNKDNYSTKFLYYYLSTNQVVSFLDNIAQNSQATFPSFSKKDLEKIDLPDLPLPTQRRIASILSTYDALIQNYKRQIAALQSAASELYKEWFVRFRFPGYKNAKFDNGLPVGWKYLTLNEIANVIMGQSPESCYYNDNKNGLPFHQGAGSYGDFYLIDGIYSTEGLRIAEPGSIIFSVRAPVGKLNITINKIILGRGVAAINSKEKKNGFLFWSLKTKFSKEDMIGNGSVFASVTKDELLKQKLLIPTNPVLNQYDEFASNIEKKIRCLYLQITNLTTQRDLLLPRLMSGKLSVE